MKLMEILLIILSLVSILEIFYLDHQISVIKKCEARYDEYVVDMIHLNNIAYKNGIGYQKIKTVGEFCNE